MASAAAARSTGIVAARRVESSVEQLDEQAGDLRLSHERAARRTTS